jgi:heme/copper-type cytochrome/quinol oxidase subunit 2
MHLSFAAGLFWTSVACCLVAQLLIVRSVLGARHVPAPTADVPRARAGVELLWAVVPAIALAVLLVFTWQAVRERDALRAAGAASASPAAEAAR